MSRIRSRPAASSCRALRFAWLLILLSACGAPDNGPGEAPQAVDDRLSIFAVNYPLAYFAGRIGGDAVRVSLPVPADADPADWRPSPETIIEFQQADLILLNGAGYAQWVETAALPNNRLVDTSRNFLDRLIRLDDTTHSHGPEGSHSHGTFASHIWLDPALATEQARAILDALITYLPDQENEFRSHFVLLERDLQALDAELTEAFAAVDGEPILFSHPVYQYLQRRYAPDSRSLNWESDVVPDTDALDALRAMRADFPAGVLIWEQAPFAITVEVLETEGLRSIAFATGGNRPAEGDYLDLMQWNLGNLAKLQPAASDGPDSAAQESD